MASREGSAHWSVLDGVKTIPAAPEALMAEINSAIAALEHARAAVLLKSPTPSSSKNKNAVAGATSHYDAQMADEAYKAGLESLADGKLDQAVHSLNTALFKCPPDKTSAVVKLQSLISVASQQLQESSN